MHWGDGSWVIVETGSPEVWQGGPRRLWDEIEQFYEEWCRLGAPSRERFGLTIVPDGGHLLWLDNQESGPWWDVTPARSTLPPGERTAAPRRGRRSGWAASSISARHN